MDFKTPNKNNETLRPLPTESKDDHKSRKRYFGHLFVFIIFVVIILEYYVFVFEIYLKKIINYPVKEINAPIAILLIFHLLLVMLLWSLGVTMNTHPGEIPLYWGFYIGDEDYKRKRYCLICNAFKPERSHHCSVCNLCVLNMDHHCPWVNNCIGFYNRKFFMQLLFYVFLMSWYITATLYTDIHTILLTLYKTRMQVSNFVNLLVVILAYGIICTLSVLITLFFRFHISLVLMNTTTIESLDPANVEDNKFRLSKFENWVQVFGENKCLWFFPILSESGTPKGDGLTWKTNSGLDIQMDNISQNKQNTDSRHQNINPNQNFFNTIKNIQDSEMKKNYNPNYDSNNKFSTNVFSPQNNNIFSPPNQVHSHNESRNGDLNNNNLNRTREEKMNRGFVFPHNPHYLNHAAQFDFFK